VSRINSSPNSDDLITLATKSLHDHWQLYFAEGIVLSLLGIGAIMVPPIAGIAVAVFLGWLFLVGGIFGLATTFMGRRTPGFWWALISSLVMASAGGFLIAWPVSSAISITMVLTAFLAVDGIVTILFAIDHRRQFSQRWGWMLVNGFIDLLLAGIIIWVLPAGALWILGLVIGFDFLFGGGTLIAMALAARKGSAVRHH
jgi:uncharacterized membrane protein HdeD (DUF308 family)